MCALIYNCKLANQIARLVVIMLKKPFVRSGWPDRPVSKCNALVFELREMLMTKLFIHKEQGEFGRFLLLR